MAKALAIGASIAAIAAVTVVTGGAALGLGVALSTSAFGVSAGSLLAASAVLSTGSSLLAPKPKAPADLSQGSRLNVSINVREPRKIVFGTTAMATDLRDQEWTSDQTYLHRFIVVASHRINAVREIWFDDKLAWTAAGGAQGEFAKWLQVTPVLEGSAANAINIGPRMGGARRFTGCAYVHLRYQILAHSKKLDSVFNQSVPSRVTIVGDGAPVYDPRRDSTVPGGSGPQRANDQSTWEWNASASRNPALCTLFYLLGWRINGRLAVGKGIPAARIDLGSFIEAANACDEPVARSAGGTEPRYRCDGVVSEGDDTQAVLDNLKASMNAVLDDVDGRLRVSVLHNDLAAPIGDLFTGDVLGAFSWQQTLPLNDSVSVIRGGYTDPSSTSLYQTADYPEVTIASRDGIERSQTVNYPLVQSASQAQRLSKQRLQRMLYGGTFSAVFQSTAWKFQKGDVIRLSFAPLGWSRKLFRIADMATQVDGKVPMMLREEHPAIYAWDASDAAPVTGAEPTRYDPALWPLVQGINEAGTTADWDKVADPTNTKPADNATNSADPNSPFGGGTVSDIQKAIAAAKAQQDKLETVTIPAVNDAVAKAGERITEAKSRADDAYSRATTAIDKAGDADAFVRREVGTLKDADTALAKAQNDAEARLGDKIAASARDVTTAFSDADKALSDRTTALAASFGSSAANVDMEMELAIAPADRWAGTIDGKGSPSAALSKVIAFNNVSCMRMPGSQGSAAFCSRAVIPVDTSRRYRISCRPGAYKTGSTPGGSIIYVGFVGLDSAGAMVDHGAYGYYRYAATLGTAGFVDGQIRDLSQIVTGEGNDSWLKFPPGTKNIRLLAILNDENGALDSYIDYLRWEDIEDSQAAMARANQALTALTDGRFATAQSVETLQAQMNMAADSGLKRDLYARVEDRATAIADSKAGVVASSVQTLEARTAARPNLQRNGGFESGMTGVAAPAGAVVVDDAASGKRVLHWAQAGETVALLPPVNVQAGARYTVSLDLTLSADTGSLRVDPSLWSGVNGSGSVTYDAVSGPGWPIGTSSNGPRKEFSFTVPGGVQSIQLRLIASNITNPRSIDVSRVKVEAGDAPATTYTADAALAGGIATITQQAGAIVDLDQRASVYWKVVGTTADGQAMISLSKSDGSAPLFYVGANMLVGGDLIVDGAVTLRTLNRSTMTAQTQASRKGYFAEGYSTGVTPVAGITGDMPIGDGGSLYFTINAVGVGSTDGAVSAAYPSVQLLDTASNVLGDYKIPLADPRIGGLANYVVRAINLWGARVIRWRLVNRGVEQAYTHMNDPAVSLYWTAL